MLTAGRQGLDLLPATSVKSLCLVLRRLVLEEVSFSQVVKEAHCRRRQRRPSNCDTSRRRHRKRGGRTDECEEDGRHHDKSENDDALEGLGRIGSSRISEMVTESATGLDLACGAGARRSQGGGYI